MIGLIWAQSGGGVIGHDGSIPWHLPEDLAHFRDTTMGATVLMGRLTWESIPDRFRPLTGRRNLVLTHRPDWAADGAERVGSLDEAIALAEADLWVIGGARVYAEALPAADRVVITYVDGDYAGDAYAPSLGPRWRPSLADAGWLTSSTGLRYKYATFERAAAIPSTS